MPLERLARSGGADRADLVQLNGCALGAASRFAAARRRCRIIPASHLVGALCTDGALPGDLRWRAELVAAASRERRPLSSRRARPSRPASPATYGLTFSPRVVHNGAIASGAGEIARRRSHAVFTAGRLWDEGKNIATLDRAAACHRMRRSSPPARCTARTAPHVAA